MMKSIFKKGCKIAALLTLMIFGLPAGVWGQITFTEKNVPFNGTMSQGTQDEYIRFIITQGGTYTMDGLNNCQVVLRGSNLKVTIKVKGVNTLISIVEGDGFANSHGYAGLDLDDFSVGSGYGNEKYNKNNTVTLVPYDANSASITAEGAGTAAGKIAGIKFMKEYKGQSGSENRPVNNNLIIDGNITVTATGGSAAQQVLPGIGGQSYGANCPGGTLTLQNGACVYEKGVNGNVSADTWYPSVVVDNYATYDQSAINTQGAQKNTKIDGILETLVYKGGLSRPQAGNWVNVYPQDATSTASYKIQVNKESITDRISFYRTNRTTAGAGDWASNRSWDYIKVVDIPSSRRLSGQANERNMGAVYDNSGSAYYKEFNQTFTSASLLLNTHNYEHTGTFITNNSTGTTFSGNGKTLKVKDFTFEGTQPLQLSNVTLSGTAKIVGKVYVDPSGEGNLTDWVTENISNQPIRYCVATLPADAKIDDVKVNGTKVTFHQKDRSLYFWTLQSTSPQTFTASNTGITYIAKATPDVQNKKIALSAVVATIGSTPYLELADAFDAVKKGETIKLEQSYTVPANTKLTLPSGIGAEETVTLDLNGKMLTSSKGVGFSASNGVLIVKSDIGTSSMVGSFSLAGCFYTALTSLPTFTDVSANSVYRVKVKNLPTNTGTFLTYSGGGSLTKAYHDSSYGACLWLPAADTEATSILSDNSEPFVSVKKEVETSHANEVDAYPYVDIQYGDINVTPQSSNLQTVVYGSKKYEIQVSSVGDKRLPVYGTSSGSGKNHAITVANGSDNVAYLTLSGVNVHPASKTALTVNGHADIELAGKNYLYGGVSTGTPAPAVLLASAMKLTWNNCKEGTGFLSAVGGYSGANYSPAIRATSMTAIMTINGGTYSILRSKGDVDATLSPDDAIDGGTQYIYAGSVNAGYTDASRPKNYGKNGTDGETIYKVTLSTELAQWVVYKCAYTGVCPDASVQWAMPDDALKFYCWMPPHTVDERHSKVEFWDSSNNQKPTIEVPEVGTHDLNAAPVAVTLIDKSGVRKTVSFGTMQEAFRQMELDRLADGRGGNYKLLVLINIAGLNTVQKVPEGTQVEMDMQGFKISHSTTALYDASNTGAYLYIHKGGDMENQFGIDGDVFIAGDVPLTHATLRKNGVAVYRTLIKGLREDDKHQYNFAQQQNVSFKLHDGLACLWLPFGQDEVRIKEGGGLEPIEYTTGVITTGMHQPDAIQARTIGTVAVMTGTDKDGNTVNKSYKTIKLAFEEAAGLSDAQQSQLTIQLLAGVSISGDQLVSGFFTLDLGGKNLSSSGNGKLQIATGADIRVVDSSDGMKGKLQTDIELVGGAKLFVSGAIQLESTVKKQGADVALWRTLVDMSYQDASVTSVTYDGANYPVVERGICLWLPVNASKDYVFMVGGKEETVKNQTITANHNNDMTIGGNNNVARIGGTYYQTVKEAFAQVADGQTVELLKTTSLATATTLGVNGAVTLELGKYGLVDGSALTVGAAMQLTVHSTPGSGQLMAPLTLAGGLLYIGADVQQIGDVKQGSTALYRLLVNELPNSIPDGVHSYTYAGTTGSCLVRNHTACLWLTEHTPAELTFTLDGTVYTTRNVGIRKNHSNTQTYGVNDVAEVWDKKYATLSEAFQNAAGGTVVLLKDAAMDAAISVSGHVVLDLKGFSIVSSTTTNTFTVGAGNNLQITGKGSVSVGFQIQPVAGGVIHSNANLQADPDVFLGTSVVNLNATPVYRVCVSGDYPVNAEVGYSYAGSQSGTVKTPALNTRPICLWMSNTTTSNSFFVTKDDKTWQAPSVVIGASHANQVTVSEIGAVAGIGVDRVYATLGDAFHAATGGETVKLLHPVSNLSGAQKLNASSGTVSFDLQKHKIESKNASFETNGATLVVSNGSLNGNITLTHADKTFMDGSLQMGNAYVVNNAGKPVWRMLLTLPDATTSFSYQIGNAEPVTGCTNIQKVDGKQVACLWLASSSQAQDMIVTAGQQEYKLTNAVVSSTHGNELDVTAGSDPVASISNTKYASLASAFAMAQDRDVVVLLKSVAPATVLGVEKSVTLNLNGKTITSTNSGFNVTTGKTLKLINSGTAPVALQGTFCLTGDGRVDAGAGVKIAGVVQDKAYKVVYRVLVDVGGTKECHWLHTYPLEYDERISSGNKTYEVTVPARLGNHEEELTAYERVELSGAVNWNDAAHAGKNIVLKDNCKWTIATAGTIHRLTIHRLTIHQGATVVATAQVTATAGIRYVRRFAANKWQSVALPYNSARITTWDATTHKPTLRVPATGSGTSGDFWLNTMLPNGQQQTVSSTELTANETYMMAVPADLATTDIYFESGPNQLLRKNKVLAVKPQTGFAAYANGTLASLPITEKCYILEEQNNEMVFARQDNTYALPPFTGYLLADLATTEHTPVLRVGVPTDVPDIRPDKQELVLYTTSGCLVVASPDGRSLPIWSVDGRCIKVVRLEAGDNRIPLAEGFYAVSRQIIYIPR